MTGVPWLSKALLLSALASTVCMAQAQTRAASTGDFQVRIEIVATCEITMPQDIDFGAIVHRVGPTEVQSTQLVVQCTNGHPYEVNISEGQNYQNSFRNMTHSDGTTIRYVLAHNRGMTNAWQPGTNDPGTGIGIGDSNFDVVHNIHAQAHLVGTESAGEYSDTVRATVTY